MARIKQPGLTYFPMTTNFLQDRLVRRVMKRMGDRSLAVLLGTLSYIYGGEGYYIVADEDFYDDLADRLYELEADEVKSILMMAVEVGIFDKEMFRLHGILTSADIQEQFLFITKRRNKNSIDKRYNLLETEENSAENEGENVAEIAENVAETPVSVTETAQNSQKTPQKYTNKTKEKKTKENPLLNGSPETGRTPTEDGDHRPPEASLFSEEEMNNKHREWTEQDIDRLKVPADGLERNYSGLRDNLQQFRIPYQEQYAIILKSNFGIIGHPVWKGFYTLRSSHGKIRQPGRYLLSLCYGEKRGGGT